MPNITPNAHLLDKTVNIRMYPGTIESPGPDERVTIGDLHGNPIKLLNFLIRNNIIQMDEEHYVAIADKYYGLDNLSRSEETIEATREIIELIKEHATVNKDGAHVTLIGDVFADRGRNDAIMLELLKHLSDHEADFTVISSNHDAFFVEYCQSYTVNDAAQIRWGDGYQGQSLVQFHRTRQSLGITDEVLEDFFQNVYAPRLKLMDYDIHEDGIVIYTHAPVPFEEIVNLARFFDVHRSEDVSDIHSVLPPGLGRILDKMNAEFVDQVKNRRLYFGDNIMDENFELYAVHWNRVGNQEPLKAPVLLYNVRMVHGHDGENTLYANDEYGNPISIPLDTLLGKSDDDIRDDYKTLRSLRTPALKNVEESDAENEVPLTRANSDEDYSDTLHLEDIEKGAGFNSEHPSDDESDIEIEHTRPYRPGQLPKDQNDEAHSKMKNG